jgi:hypothetical protein
VRDYSKLLLSNFLHLVILALRFLEFVRWNYDDAITLDPLRMRDVLVINDPIRFDECYCR